MCLLLIPTQVFAQAACVPVGPRIALTFDDGPVPSKTPIVLDILKAHGAQATFFLVGRQVSAGSDIVRRAWQEGHELAVHTWSHKDLARINQEKRNAEINKGFFAIRSHVPEADILWWRAPYGSSPSLGYAPAKSLGMRHMLWSIDTEDWRGHSAQKMFDKIINQARDGSVVLMHDHGKNTVHMLDALLSELTFQGYQMVSLSSLTAPTCALGRVDEQEI